MRSQDFSRFRKLYWHLKKGLGRWPPSAERQRFMNRPWSRLERGPPGLGVGPSGGPVQDRPHRVGVGLVPLLDRLAVRGVRSRHPSEKGAIEILRIAELRARQ